jgi:hypothetical protein
MDDCYEEVEHEVLLRIEFWPISDPKGLIDFICKQWAWKTMYELTDTEFELHTGGESGHEMIIDSLQKNPFWDICWMKSERGGHYYFDLTKFTQNTSISSPFAPQSTISR